MSDNATLLREYAINGSEAAFAELLARHVDLVYSTALRLLGGDAALAHDVAQTVFTDLARKAGSLPQNIVLAGWLHRHTRFTVANTIRAEQRRRTRERKAAAMQAINEDSDAVWQELAPVLDEAIGCLRTRYRDAILLRFFGRQSLRAVGVALGISEEAARKVVDRALAVLRNDLTRRGVGLSAASLVITLETHAVSAAPAGFATAMTEVSLTTAPATAGTLSSFLRVLLMAKLQTAALGLLFVAGVATPFLLNSRADAGATQKTHSPAQLDTSPTPPTQAAQALNTSAAPNPNSALARLETWLHRVDQTNPNAIEIDDELRFLIWSLGARDYAQAWRLREGLRSTVLRSRFQYELLGFWSKLDPQAALAAAGTVSKDTPGNNTVALVLANWGEKDPDGAMAWARQSQPDSRRPYRLAEALQGVAKTDPFTALKLAEALPGIGARSLASQNIIREWAESDPESAAHYMAQMAPSRQRANNFETLAQAWAESDPEAAAAWARALPSPAERNPVLNVVIRIWQQSDPEAALSWLQRSNLPDTKSVVHPKSQ